MAHGLHVYLGMEQFIKEIRSKLNLDFTTTSEYEMELRTSSQYSDELDRLYKEAMKEVNNRKLQLEIIAAEVVQEIIEKYEKDKGKRKLSVS